jgi:hypothetical protein
MPEYDSEDSYSDTSPSTDLSDSNGADDLDEDWSGGGYGADRGLFGRRSVEHFLYIEVRNRRQERKLYLKQKRTRRDAKAREKRYALYLTCVPRQT